MTIEGPERGGVEEPRASEELGRALDAVRPPFGADAAVKLAKSRSAGPTIRVGPRRRALRWAIPLFAGGPIVAALLLAARPSPPPLPTIVRIAEIQRIAEVERTVEARRTAVGRNAASAAAPETGSDGAPPPYRVERRDQTPRPGEDAARLASFSIDAPPSGKVAVFQTSNPRIRVVWFYDEEGSED